METFSALLAICAGNSPVSGQWRGALVFSLICVWINGWVNNREAGDLRRYRAHYDVSVMYRNDIFSSVDIHGCLCDNAKNSFYFVKLYSNILLDNILDELSYM